MLDSGQLREKNTAYNKGKEERYQMCPINAESSGDGCSPGCLEPVFFSSALKKYTGKKRRYEHKCLCSREKADWLIGKYSERGRRMVYHHHDQQTASQDIELNQSFHGYKQLPLLTAPIPYLIYVVLDFL